eukprot:CAMPEP_0183358684 /NCGR_PEP_ID=MMETSP0164_2-20130417/49932_1 /TAXON_ID=221442 /ORGANISM="Coccolithus pelagicus ssp braarudi, Strain PLY182g" /LENGTH=71 /DNA_ID=CAMNT_0025532623 /DNA_START=97 /DNA_END=312 /DNA_ORIENTATION=+
MEAEVEEDLERVLALDVHCRSGSESLLDLLEMIGDEQVLEERLTPTANAEFGVRFCAATTHVTSIARRGEV